ncbi:MAG: DUF1802 family protein, partial [Limisphaerales bacterium]
MRAAFKDWAIVVDALGRGDQIIILRKGGISEGRGGFQMQHDEFLLFPTRYHQQGEMVTPEAAGRWSEIEANFPPEDVLRFEFCAQVEEWHEVQSLEQANQLRGQHIWKDQIIADRYEWGREQKIFAIALRVFQLPDAVDLPMLKEYGGCKSWIEVAQEIDTTQTKPVLSDGELA